MALDKTTADVARMAGGAAAAAADAARVGQELALGALRAEMLALAAMLPGATPAMGGAAAREAEVEAGFDNMPV